MQKLTAREKMHQLRALEKMNELLMLVEMDATVAWDQYCLI